MKKIFAIISFVLLVNLVGCTLNSSTNDGIPTVNLDTNKSVMFSTYMMSSLLTETNLTSNNMFNNTNDYHLTKLTSTTEPSSNLKVETQLDEVNQYFNRLKVFIDNGVDSALNMNDQASTMPGYDHEITYTIGDINYTIYYSLIDSTAIVTDGTTSASTTTSSNNQSSGNNNQDNEAEDEDEHESDHEDNEADDENENEDHEQTNQETINQEFKGLMVIDQVQYQLIGGNMVQGEEQYMWFKTVNPSHQDDSVKVVAKTENNNQEFSIETSINGIKNVTKIKFEQESEEQKVVLKLINGEKESTYKIKKETEDNKTVYKFQYELDGVKGEIKAYEMTDGTGNITYKYDIKEDGHYKEIEKKEHEDEDSNHEENDA